MRQTIYQCDHCGKREIDTTYNVRGVRVEYDMNADCVDNGSAKFGADLCSRCAAEFVDAVSLFFAGVGKEKEMLF